MLSLDLLSRSMWRMVLCIMDYKHQMEQNLSLTPAQIQYLKIGPKVASSATSTRLLQDSLAQFQGDLQDSGPSLSSIPKYSFGYFENTVHNFGVLLHRNFVGTTTLHQAQKFGKIAFRMDRTMQDEEDRPMTRKGGHKKTLADERTVIKAIYEVNNHKVLVSLRSFSIEAMQTHRVVQTLPLSYLRSIVEHVPSSKLSKVMQGVFSHSMSLIDFDKLQSKVSSQINSQLSYLQGPYVFERSQQKYVINLPLLQVYHSQSDYRRTSTLDNRDIIAILQSDFDNVESVVGKYVDLGELQSYIQKNAETKNKTT